MRLLFPLAAAVVAVALPASALAGRALRDEPAAAVGTDGTFLINGVRSFPIGLTLPPPLDATTPSGEDALDEVVDAGVTFLAAGAWGSGASWTDAVLREAKAWDSAAAARGVHTWIYLRELARAQPRTAAEAMLRRVVTTLASDPGLGLWKGVDEPWWAGVTALELRWAYCLTTSRGEECDPTQALDPNHLWVTIEAPRGAAADLEPYAAVTDTHGVDVYPIGIRVSDPDLHRVGIWTQTLASITRNHNVWTTLEICHSGSFDGSGSFVLPTAAQERYMAYDAIINGARALNFYGGRNPNCFSPTDAPYGWNWTFWNGVLKNLLLEIGARSALYPALLVPENAISVTSSDPTTEVIARRVGRNEIWAIAARSGPGTDNVTFSGLPSWTTLAPVYNESRTVTASGGVWRDTFSRWDVHVYRFDRWLLSVTKKGSGVGTVTSSPAGIDCGSDCSVRFANSSSVTLSVAPKKGSVFTGWGGDCSGMQRTCTLALSSDRSVTAGLLACLVPQVKRKPVAKARHAIKAAHCAVGKVTKAFSARIARGRVISQKPKAGARRSVGAKVSLVISKGTKRRR